MSTTDELLEEMLEDVEEYATPVTDDDLQFWIDEHLRVISIPKNGVVAGVEGDKNVNKIKFGMNRYYHDFDMSTFSGRILYSNAKGNKNYYNITDMQASGSIITFSWLVDADAVQYMGKTAFVVYLFKIQGSELRQKFFSTLATLKVLEGMEVDSAVPVEKQTDIIERMKEEISAYAEEVKKSLPADYTAMTEQVSSLKEDVNNLKSSGANNESLIVIYDILSKGTYTEDISSLMSQLDGLVHDGMYKITSDVENATLSNKSNYVAKESKYTCTVTASLGYKISAVVVTMGGVDISSSNYDKTTKTVTIESVTGNVNITVTTIESDFTSLKYIKGDGNSWIDTGVVADVNHRYELSAKLDGDDADEYFFGADQYNVGSAYNQFVMKTVSTHAKIMGTINKSAVDVGTWNVTENNLLSNKKMYLVVKNGSQEIYLNSDYTEKQSQYTAGSASFGSQDTLPIIPLYLFHVNTTTSTNPINATTYKRSEITVFWLKIYDDTTNEMLHEFLPVAKNGKIGMFDTVTKEFHANIGTGTFTYEEA
nr:MAG TPA: hypothetical protein [Caudoviricetes sp.]